MGSPFQVGDRVIAIVVVHGMPPGTLGSIVRVLRSIDDFYDVQFDEHPVVRLVAGDVLALAPQESDCDTV